MLSFKEKANESTQMRIVDLLPKKVKRMIYRTAHADKYKGALLMMKHLRKDPDVISRGLSKQKIQQIAADHFGLNHREFAKVLNRQTRYEEKTPARPQEDDSGWVEEYINEAYTVAIDKASEIDKLNYPKQSQKDALKKLYAHLRDNYKDFKNPLIFDPNPNGESSRRAVKVHTDLEAKGVNIVDIKANKLNGEEIDWGSDLPPLKFGTGSADKKIDWTEFGISNTTAYIEFCQSIGFFLKSQLKPNNFVDDLDKLFITGDFTIREYITDWKYFIDFCNADPVLQKEVMLLVNGSYFYKEQIKIKSPYVLWNGIDTYYANLKKKENIKGDVKPNTADCCLIENATPEALYKALASKSPITTNESTGKLMCGGISWYQISLKKVRDGAQLGKLTTILKGTFDQKDTPLTVLAKIDDIYYAKHKELDEDYDKQFDNLLIEGFFGDAVAKVKQLGGDAFDKLKSAVIKIMKFTGGLFKKMSKLLKQEEKKHDKLIDDITKKFLKEEALMESNKLLRERKGKPTTAEKLDAIVREDDLNKKYKSAVMKAFNDVKVINETPIAFKKETQTIKEIKAGDINFLAGNVITFGMLNNITDEVKKKGISFINDLNQSMLMGDTKIPVVKLYGNESKADTEVLTVSKINQNDPKVENKKIDLVKINIKPKGGKDSYWVCNMWMFANMKDGVPRYHKVSFKKSGKGFNYNIEGTATFTADKITPFPMEKE